MEHAEDGGGLPLVVVLVGLPRMILEVVGAIVGVLPGVQIAGEFAGEALASGDVLAVDPEVLIVGDEWASEETVAYLLDRRCSLKVLAISSDGRRAMLHELRPHRVPIDELSRESLERVLRPSRLGAARRGEI